MGFVSTLVDVIYHVLIVSDAANHGNSTQCIRWTRVTEMLGEIVLLILSILHVLFEYTSGYFHQYIFLGTVGDLKECWEHVKTMRNSLVLSEVVHEQLPPPPPEKLDDDCLICRLPLDSENSRMLPCGHCFHVECILRWANQKTTCPTCGADLNKLAEQARGGNWLVRIVTFVTVGNAPPAAVHSHAHPRSVAPRKDLEFAFSDFIEANGTYHTHDGKELGFSGRLGDAPEPPEPVVDADAAHDGDELDFSGLLGDAPEPAQEPPKPGVDADEEARNQRLDELINTLERLVEVARPLLEFIDGEINDDRAERERGGASNE
jgi:ribosomal protein S27E